VNPFNTAFAVMCLLFALYSLFNSLRVLSGNAVYASRLDALGDGVAIVVFTTLGVWLLS
jgi:hypothetical protein